MKITKLGHCCLLIEERGVRILTDPGNYSQAQNEVEGIDIILITHEHQDHLHLDSLKIILRHNPQVKIFTNHSVGNLLASEGIEFNLLEDGAEQKIKEVKISAWGNDHAEIYQDFKKVQNTGFMIADRFFYPGDALYVPTAPVEILALPVAGPWLRIKEAIDYALQIKPQVAFPVHDGMLKITGGFHKVPEAFLPPAGIGFKVLDLLHSYEF